MYINTGHHIGNTVYFLQGGECVTRGEVREIHVSKYEHGQHILYAVVFMNSDGEKAERRLSENELHHSADSAFYAWDRAHPAETPTPETAEA